MHRSHLPSGVHVSPGYIRKVLAKHGYKWLPRSQKRQYDAQTKAERIAFAKQVLTLSRRRLRERLSLAMDGVVLGMPPANPIDRWNFCKYGDVHLWRKPQEAASPELAGNDPFGKQFPIARSIPMWGGVSGGGFAPIMFHSSKKVKTAEWCEIIRHGKLTKAIKSVSPSLANGPWWVLCDNEAFLRAPATQPLYRDAKIKLWKIPKHSPDCNPVEKFWSWLRRKLQAMDLKDALAKKAVLGKAAYRQRVRSVCSSQEAQRVAKACAFGLRKVCKEIVAKKGAATRG
jgi:hypothetical protein